LGLSAIKEHGGLTLAQAGFDHAAMSGMPSSAADTGFVDAVLPVEAMPARLAAYRLSRIKGGAATDESTDRTNVHVTAIGVFLRARCDHDFTDYKQSTMLRRIHRRMHACRIDDLPAYVAHVKEQPEELDALFRDLLIGVTEFFRDPQAFEALREQVIAPLLAQRDENDQIRIWVPGCATGEEAYSLAILVAEEMEKREERRTQQVQIFATDIDDRAIAQARSGRYLMASAGLSPERAGKWFTPEGDGHVVIRAIRDMCVFSTHDVTRDPPFSKLDLISCRNLLIYFENGLQDRAMRTFHYALRPDGALFLRSSEGVNRNTKFFASLDKKHRLYRRCDDGRSRPETPQPLAHAMPRAPVAMPRAPLFSDDHLDKSARRALEVFSPAYVIVDKNNDIRRFSGSEAGRFLETSAGHASLNLFTLLRKPLRPVVRAALATLAKTREVVVHDRMALKIDGDSKSVKVIVAPLADNETQEGYCVVAFQEMNAAAPLLDSMAPDQMFHANIQLLEDELFTVKAQLDAAVSEFEVVNEEMRAANEEFQSANEELQSSNEELETTKEEMQSVNEELQTVNGEMIAKNALLVLVNSDLKNVLESTEIATLFLDNNLHVKSFSPGMRDLFHLRDADFHRPINEIATLLSYADLASDAARVIRSLAIQEREVENATTGAAYIMCIRPYRRVDNLLDGVVVTFVDITALKRAQRALREGESALRVSQSRLRVAADAARLTFADYDLAKDLVERAENFVNVMGYKPRVSPTGAAIETGLASLLDHSVPADRPRISHAYQQLRAGLPMDRVEYRLIGDDSVERWIESVGQTEMGDDGRPARAFVTSLDITSQVESRNALAAAKEKADEILASIGDGFYALDEQWRFVYFNARAEKLLGKQRDEVIGQLFSDVFPMCKDSLVHANYRRVMTAKQPLEFEYVSDILKRWTAYSVYPTHEGGVSVYIRDISKHKAVEGELVAAKAEAERANQAKSKFLAAASHDLRQPVQSLVLLLSVIERQVAGQLKTVDTAKMMRAAVDGLHGLLTSVLDISRLDAGVVAPVVDCVDLGALVGRLAVEYAPKAASRGLEFRSLPLQLQSRTDAALLERALRNLIENALRYTPEGGILLGVRSRGGLVRLDVIDTGIGIPDDKQTEIFDEFHQLNNPGRNLDQGLGLGLAIVGRLASLLGAEVEVASRVGRGSRFSLYLPRIHEAPRIVAVHAPIDDPGGRVLIIEDNANVRNGLEASLRQCGYETLAAASGEDALELAAKEAWRLAIIVTDYRLGAGLNGIEAATEIHRRAGRSIPTLVLTGDTAIERIVEIDASGFAILHKPVDVEELRRVLARLLGESTAQF